MMRGPGQTIGNLIDKQGVSFIGSVDSGGFPKETARLTDERIEIGESTIADLDMKLSMLADRVAEHPEIAVTYFKPDEKKDGGAYVTVTGVLKKIDDYEHVIVFKDGKRVAISDILEIEFEGADR